MKNSPLKYILLISLISWIGDDLKAYAQAPEKPNFVIIFADDMGYGDLSSYGHPTIHTPNLDRMASEGQKWTNFYVGSSVCTPSRAAIMTGRLPVRNGMTSKVHRVLQPWSTNGMPQSEITIAEQLKKAGYNTGAFGKWHLGSKEQYLPVKQGFDYWYGIPYSNDMDVALDFESVGGFWGLWKSDKRKDIATFDIPLMRGTEVIERPANQHTITKRYTDEAIAYMKENKDTPFFVYLAYNLPHVPLFVSEDFEGKSKRGLYGDVVEEIDFNVGKVLEALKEEGLAENTIVVFTSDNGPWLAMKEESGSAGMLRDGKGSTWEGGMREPGIFWSPGNVKPGMVTELGSTMDLFTTFSKLAGVEIPEDRVIDGQDLSSTLFEGKESPRKTLFYYRGDEVYAVRYGSYKAHFVTQSAYGDDREEHNPPLLYNLDIDPSESYEISKDHPQVIEDIMKVVQEHNKNMVKGPDLLKDWDHNPFEK